MAKINTSRPEAAQYNGRTVKFVRDVTGGPAYNPHVDQVIVETDGAELYFFANEVELTDDEGRQAERQADRLDWERRRDAHFASERRANLQDHFAGFSRRRKSHSRDQPPTSPISGVASDQDRFNRTPSTPPAQPQTDQPAANPTSMPPANEPVTRPAGTGPEPGAGVIGQGVG